MLEIGDVPAERHIADHLAIATGWAVQRAVRRRKGAQVGGALADMGSYQGYGMLADPQAITLPPGQIMEGGILVNAEGRRFVNEVVDIAGMIHPVLASRVGSPGPSTTRRSKRAAPTFPKRGS